jgi:hypothetical protein
MSIDTTPPTPPVAASSAPAVLLDHYSHHDNNARTDRGPVDRASFWRGRAEDPVWVRPSLLALLLATAVLYLWGLGASGWANSFYSAAAQAGSASWKAFFFGSSDAANSNTVDKTPMSLWAMALSVRVFGLSPWSILAPQALMGSQASVSKPGGG